MDIPFNGNWVDLGIVLILFFYLWTGLGRGFVLGVFDLLGFIASFSLSLKYYTLVGSLLVTNFSIPRGIANAVGFLITGIVFESVFAFFVNLLFGKLFFRLKKDMGGKKTLSAMVAIDRLLGSIPALGEAVILIAFFLTLLVSLPVQGAVKKSIVSSRLGGPLVAHTQGIERTLQEVFGAAVNESLTFLTINPNPISDETVDLGFTQTAVRMDAAAEGTMLFLVNTERKKAGQTPLMSNPELTELARRYARDMLAQGYFSHYNKEGESPFNRMEKAGISYNSAGENLALAPNVSLAHQGLMNSTGHRANILSADFGQVGIGVVDGGIYGEMFVQEFID